MYNPEPGYQFVHGIYIPPREGMDTDALFAVIKNKNTDETKLQLVKNPKIKVWMMRKALRSMYDERIEDAPLSQLDEFVCNYRDMVPMVAKELGYRINKYNNYINPRTIMSSPYLFGGDVVPLVRMKQEYMETTPGLVKNLSFGAYDLEVSVLGDNEILCSSFVDWNRKHAYCHINAKWYQPTANWEEELNNLFLIKKEEAYRQMNDKAKGLFKPEQWQVKFVMCDTEKDLILKTWAVIHESKVLFLGIWNATYDNPMTIERAKFNMIDVTDLYSHPSVPKQWRYFKYRPDMNKNLQHFTDRWDIVENTAYCYIFDSMCLYSRTRKVLGRESSYALDFISRKVTGIGKIGLEDTGNHHLMQTKYKAQYCVYNVFDSIDVGLINAVTDDLTGMLATQGPSLISDLAKQTTSLVHQFYQYALEHNRMIGTAGGNMATKYDEYIGNVGGVVADPNKLKTPGAPCLKESNDGTWMRKLTCDLDVTSFYPSMCIAANMSRATKILTVLHVDGEPHSVHEIDNEESSEKRRLLLAENAEYIDNLFGRLTCVTENCISVCTNHFNLPGYEEMLKIYKSQK